ncbi:MoaD family protein [Verrucomicrobiota bacterium]|nr:MoaD family protein [Verrucomicrobiota bacterium]
MPPRLTTPAPGATTIAVSIPTPLRDCCRGAAELSIPATDLHVVLAELERRYPRLHRSICDETGAVRRHINLFVNTHHMRDRDGLATRLAAGDVVTIMTAVSGG